MELKALIMDDAAMKRSIVRISHEVVESNKGVEQLCLIGIKTRGVPLAERIAQNIKAITGADIPVGVLDITLYRDDLSEFSEQATVNATDIPFDIKGMHAVLIDDVIYTGRTARAALDALLSLGRASRISLAVLIDRGHRELPIRADYVGKNVPTSNNEVIAVRLTETDGADVVGLYLKDMK